MTRRGEHGRDQDPARGSSRRYSDLQRDLSRAIANQRAYLRRSGIELPQRVQADSQSFERLSPAQQEAVQQNLRLMSLLTGHGGNRSRSVVKEMASSSARSLAVMQDWIDQAVRNGEIVFEGPVAVPPSEYVSASPDTRDLYERLLFAQRLGSEPSTREYQAQLRDAVHRAMRLTPESSYRSIVDRLFTQDPRAAGMLVTSLGFIPRELYRDSGFRALEPSQILGVEKYLRSMERMGSETANQAREERTRLTEALFRSGVAKRLRTGTKETRYVTLDSNGIKIQFDGRRAGKGKPLLDHPFVAHIPYGLLSDETVTVFERDGWLVSESELLELQLRRAQENHDVQEMAAKSSHQLSAFADRFGLTKETIESTRQTIVDEVVGFPDRFAARVLRVGEILPDEILESASEQGERGIFAVMRFAEAVTAQVSNEALSNKRLFLEHGIAHSTREAYKARSQVMADPRYYNALKVVRFVLAQQPQSDAQRQFLVFRGRFKKSRDGRQHSFLEVVHEGLIARVLVDEEKELKPDQVGAIPVFEREVYEEVEESLRAFDYFMGRLEQMKKLLQYKNKQWERKFRENLEEAEVFVLTNATDQYPGLATPFEKLRQGEIQEERALALLDALASAANTYQAFLYQGATPKLEGFRDTFRPSVRVHEVTFGDAFVQLAKDRCPDWGYDEELSREAQGVRVVELQYSIDHPSQTIPVDVEEAVLDKLRVSRNRPLINVVGGCRFVDMGGSPEEHPLNKMTLAVLSVAHESKANVAVPGTQSGIGVYFGQQSVRYRQATEHLPFRDRAHLFAVSPGGNTVYPENPWMAQTQPSERYAVAPVDTVVTPITANWWLKGEERIRGYDLHIAYMESLFARISKEQPRVLVAGNGGVFSIMEINESIKHGFDILLIEDSGRFAEAAAVVVCELDRLPDVDDPDFDEHVRLLLQATLAPNVAAEHFKEDYGSTQVPEGEMAENYAVHRKYFREFVRLARQYPERVHVTKLDGLEERLRTFLVQEK